MTVTVVRGIEIAPPEMQRANEPVARYLEDSRLVVFVSGPLVHLASVRGVGVVRSLPPARQKQECARSRQHWPEQVSPTGAVLRSALCHEELGRNQRTDQH